MSRESKTYSAGGGAPLVFNSDGSIAVDKRNGLAAISKILPMGNVVKPADSVGNYRSLALGYTSSLPRTVVKNAISRLYYTGANTFMSGGQLRDIIMKENLMNMGVETLAGTAIDTIALPILGPMISPLLPEMVQGYYPSMLNALGLTALSRYRNTGLENIIFEFLYNLGANIASEATMSVVPIM